MHDRPAVAPCDLTTNTKENRMRPYPADSPEAMARLLTLALVADGSVHRDELALLEQNELMTQIGIDKSRFEAVYCEFHEDMWDCAERLADGYLVLAPAVVDRLLDDIRRPALQMMLVRSFLDIGNSDQVLTGAETELLARAMRRWDVDIFSADGVGIPVRRTARRPPVHH
jgi:hypothetical protein